MSDAVVLQNPSSVSEKRSIIAKWNDTGSSQKGWIRGHRNTEKLIERIESFSSLPENWNENGAQPISERVVQRAIMLGENLPHEPEVFPTARDSIQFEYEIGNNYLEIELYEDHCSLFIEYEDGKEEELSISSFADISKKVIEFHASLNNTR